ncbi:MAG: hypothetical protein RLZZ546_1959 [Bacteroidota bacterium]|jgi:photosystem II stability/assembly factor-like uncharacterized protein
MRILYFTALCLFLIMCKNGNNKYPLPTDGIYINPSMKEDGKQANRKKEWLEMIHGGKYSNWRAIESENKYNNYLLKSKNRFTKNRDGEELLADGNILGKWIERGSNNQSGSIMNVYYDNEDDYLYAIGAGGPLFRGSLDGFSWEKVNDDIVFHENVLEMLEVEGKKRLICAFNDALHYSDDFGLTWIKSTGITESASGSQIKRSLKLANEVFIIKKRGSANKFVLYRTQDGSNYKVVHNFTTTDFESLDMCLASDLKTFYVSEVVNNKSKIFTYDVKTSKLVTLNNSTNFVVKKIQVAHVDSDTLMYTYDDENKFYESKDKGATWEQQSILQSTPWGVGFYVVPSNPLRMLFGEVNAHRSQNAGKSWTVVNEWYEYYGDVFNKLHADIMVMKEFKDKSNKPVLIIGHHGGISISYDYGLTTKNISIFGLNVSQYYDVATSPLDPNLIFAGAQDQGLQRGRLVDEDISDFDQVISGDYGHNTFSNNGKGFWTMYPGGSVSYYDKPETQQFPTAGYEVEKENGMWIPPIMHNPHSTVNEVFMAGGSASNEAGSKIIRLFFDGSGIQATNLPYNFGGNISAIAVSPLNPNVWYAANSSGIFYKSTDGGMTFKNTASNVSNDHYLYGACILPSAIDSNVVYVSGSGYGGISPVYKSVNGGLTFSKMNEGLPPTTAFNIVANEDESKLFAATEAGPFVYIQSQNKWFSLIGSNTPNQTYWSVEYIPSIKTARFATYGRGVWDFVESPLSSKTKDTDIVQVKAYPNPTFDVVFLSKETNGYIIFNQSGLVSLSSGQKTNQIDMNNLINGIYFVQLNIENKKITKKIIKV